MACIGADLLSFCVYFMNILKILDNIYGDVSGVGWASGAAAQGRRVREAAERAANECFKFRKKKKKTNFFLSKF